MAATPLISKAGDGSGLRKEGAGIHGAVKPMHGYFYDEAPAIITAGADVGVALRAEFVSTSQGSLTYAEDQLASLLYDNDVGSQMDTQTTSAVDDEMHDSGIGSHVIDVGIKVIHNAPERSNHVTDVAIPTDFKTASGKRVTFSLVNTKCRGDLSSSMVQPLHAMPSPQQLALVPSLAPEPQSSRQHNDEESIDAREDGSRGGKGVPYVNMTVSEDALVTASLERDSEYTEAVEAVEDLLQHVLSQTNDMHNVHLESSLEPPAVEDMAAEEEYFEGLNMQREASLYQGIPVVCNDPSDPPSEAIEKHVYFSSFIDSTSQDGDSLPPAKIGRGSRSTRSKKATPMRRSAQANGSGTPAKICRSKRC